jgi:hypothetical protein
MMTISKNSDCTSLNLDSDLLDLIFSSPAPYTIANVTIYSNCCDCDNYDIRIPYDDEAGTFSQSQTDQYTYSGGIFQINPKVINASNTKFADGVYKIVVTVKDDAEGTTTSTEGNCFFVDCETSCKVAKHLKDLLKTETDTEVHLLHFGLTNANNCNCNCDEMCELYRKLFNILNDTDKCLCCN